MSQYDSEASQGYSSAELDALSRVHYSFLASDEPAWERTGVVRRLGVVRDLFKDLRDRHDPRCQSYEQKLFLLFDDLLHKAQGFDASLYVEEGTPPRMPQRSYLEDFDRLDLVWYADIVQLWEQINELDLPRDRTKLAGQLENLHAQILELPQDERLSLPRAALRDLVGMWWQELDAQSGINAESWTKALPANYRCIFRIQIENTTNHSVEVSPSLESSSDDVKITEKGPRTSICAPIKHIEFTWQIECQSVGKRRLQLHVKLPTRPQLDREFIVYFYSQTFKEQEDPYEANEPFPFPSRKKYAGEIADEIRQFASIAGSNSLVIELHGRRRSGKTSLTKWIREDLAAQVAIAEPSPPLGGAVTPVHCEELWVDLLAKKPERIPMLLVDGAYCLSKRGALSEELFAKAKAEGYEKAVFLFTLTSVDMMSDEWRRLKELDPPDILHLLGQAGVVGGKERDDDILFRAARDSFIHFDYEVVRMIWRVFAHYPGLAIFACRQIVDFCNKEQLMYVTAEDVQSCIDTVCKNNEALFQEDFLRMVQDDDSKLEDLRKLILGWICDFTNDFPDSFVSSTRLAQELRKHALEFDLRSEIQYLVDEGIIISTNRGYRFRFPLFRKLASRYVSKLS